MDLGQRSAASSNNPFGDADIVAYLEAVRLGEASSSRQQQAPLHLQQRYAAPTSPLVQPAPSQTLWPTTPPGVHPLVHQFQRTRQFWPMPQQQRYPWDESSWSGGYGSKIGAAAYNPQHIAVSYPYKGMLSASASHYNPMALPRAPVAQQPCMLSASASQYQPVAASCLPVASSPRTASSSTSQQYQTFGSPYYQRGDESCLLNALRGIQAGFPQWLAPPTIRRGRTMDEIRSELLSGPMEVQVALFPETSAHVVCLLGEGGDEIRLSVLAGVKRNVHKVMDSREGHKVFVALLHCCEGRFHELQSIVQAAVVVPNPNARGSLLRSAKQEHGETSIKELITAVAQYPKLCAMIIDCFVREQIMDHSRGEQLLHHCFATMRYEDSLILIQYAIAKMDKMLSSAFGSRCLAECFANASGAELHFLEQVLISNANEIARGQYSNYFVQRVLECGSMETKQRIVELLMGDVVSLSHHQFGSYVVEACFLRSGLPAMSTSMHSMLTAFLTLGDDGLGELVQGGFSNYVVHKLLETGKDHYPQETVALARRIERLPQHTLEEMHARQVLRVIKRLFPRHGRIY